MFFYSLYKFVLTVVGVGLFAVLDNATKRVIVASCICGATTFTVSEILSGRFLDGFIIYLMSACVTCVMAEVGARLMQVPVTVILLPAIIPLVPGALLYGAIKSLLQGKAGWYEEYGREAIIAVFGIGIAIVVVSLASKTVFGLKNRVWKCLLSQKRHK